MSKQEDFKLVKDRDCIGCKKLFDCKGKPRGILCVNKVDVKRNSDNAKVAAMWDNDPDTED